MCVHAARLVDARSLQLLERRLELGDLGAAALVHAHGPRRVPLLPRSRRGAQLRVQRGGGAQQAEQHGAAHRRRRRVALRQGHLDCMKFTDGGAFPADDTCTPRHESPVLNP